jgi:hypothetical protein
MLSNKYNLTVKLTGKWNIKDNGNFFDYLILFLTVFILVFVFIYIF